MKKTSSCLRLCSKHRKLIAMIDSIESMINDAASISASSHHTTESSFTIDGQRDAMNRILAEAKLTPVRSQTIIALKKQSKSGLRRLVSKLTRGTHAFQGISRNRTKRC